MNEAQKKAATQVTRALKKAGKAGLTGGVFDGTFCLWPMKDDGYIMEGGLEFFERIEEKGELLYTSPIRLDGGAGV